jgi:hypothetical protein
MRSVSALIITALFCCRAIAQMAPTEVGLKIISETLIAKLDRSLLQESPVFSPDGRRVAYVVKNGGKSLLSG